MIETVDDFRIELETALKILKQLIRATPQYEVYLSINAQLMWLEDATRTADPRKFDEKARFTFGLLAVRELDDSADPAARELAIRLHRLSYFIDQE